MALHPFLRAALALAPLRPASYMVGELPADNRLVRRFLQGEEMPAEWVFVRTLELIDRRIVELRQSRLEIANLIASGKLRKTEPVPPADRIEQAERAHRRRLDFEE